MSGGADAGRGGGAAGPWPRTVIVAGDLGELDVASTDFAVLRLLAAARPDAPVLHFPETAGEAPPPALTALRAAGAWVDICPPPRVRSAGSPHGRAAALPLRVHEVLKAWDLDAVIGAGDPAALHFVVQAGRVGLRARPLHVTLCVSAPLFQQFETGRRTVTDYADLALGFMQRRAVEGAQRVLVQNRAAADWMTARGWQVAPGRVTPMPGLAARPAAARRHPDRPAPLRRVIHAGRQNDTGGLTTLVYALERIRDRLPELEELVISGAPDPAFPAAAFLQAASERLDLPVRHLPETERAAFLDLACAPGSLGVIGGRAGERPMALAELLALDAPVLAADPGDGNPDLAPADAARVLVAPHHVDLGRAILARAAEGLVTDHASLRGAELAANARAWGRALAPAPPAPAVARTTARPLVSVCIAHFNRPETIADTLRSVAAQTYGEIEVVVVDDGSAPAELARLETVLAAFPAVRLVPQENLYLGAARNAGARAARGAYLLFMDDDNIAMPHEVATFVDVAERTGADILTCFSDTFTGPGPPTPGTIGGLRRVPFGQDPVYGMFRNGFGDSNCFMRRDAWEALGGFSEHFRIGLDDQELFLRATREGWSIEVIPEALYYYRLGGEKMKRFHVARQANSQRILASSLAGTPEGAAWLPVVLLARTTLE